MDRSFVRMTDSKFCYTRSPWWTSYKSNTPLRFTVKEILEATTGMSLAGLELVMCVCKRPTKPVLVAHRVPPYPWGLLDVFQEGHSQSSLASAGFVASSTSPPTVKGSDKCTGKSRMSLSTMKWSHLLR